MSGNGKDHVRADQAEFRPGHELPEEELAADWTPHMVALWDAMTASYRDLFRGEAWDTPAVPSEPVRLLVDYVRQCRRHYKITLEDLLSAAGFADGFGGGTHGRFHSQWAREIWEANDKDERAEAEATAEFAEKETAAQQAVARMFQWSEDTWDIATIPARPWIASPYLMRRHITLVHGPGGASKSLIVGHWAIALTLKRPFGRLTPRGAMRVLLANFEDDEEEQTRRLSVALDYFNAAPADLAGKLRRVSLGKSAADATMFRLDDAGQLETTPAFDALIWHCETFRPDVVTLDPLIAINAAPESDNSVMRRVMTILRVQIALRFNCALILVHHDAKGGGDDTATDQVNARGAGDIVNAVRFELATKTMTLAQAEGFGLEREQRKFLFRVGSEDSKRNYSAPDEAEWFERIQTPINGEAVVRCVPWQPPDGKLADHQATKLIAEIGRGTSAGPFSPQLGDNDRSLSPLMEALGIGGSLAQRRAMKDLKLRFGIVEGRFKRRGHGSNERKGLRTAAGAPYNCEWCDVEEEAADAGDQV